MGLDLSKFSTSDLIAIKSGDLSKVSTVGLSVLKEQASVANAVPANADSMPANAGMVNFAATVAGIPVDTAQNAINLGLAGIGSVANMAGRPDLAPDLVKGAFGGSESIKSGLRALANKTGVQGLNPDSPTVEPATSYTLASRGAMVPGAAIPAVGSMIAESLGGPKWAGVGALLPSALGMAARATASNLSSRLTPEAKLLQKEGVPLTPGQIAGGGVKRVEDAATSIPVLGDAIKASQRRGVEMFGTAAINRSLAPIGERLPKNLTGSKAVEYAYGKLGDAYDALLPRLKGDLNAVPGAGTLPAKAGQAALPSFRQKLDSIKAMGQSLPEAQRSQLNAIIDKEVIGQFTKSGIASGETLKNIESLLGSLAKKKLLSDNYHETQLGGAIKEIQASMREMVNEVNPAYHGELAKINQGYANFKIVQKAASSPATINGVFTPSQLNQAVRAKDISKDKARFSEGNALMQDLSASGKSVLPSSVPDSGTPFRGALMYALAHPLKAGALSVPIGLGTLPYTQFGQGLLSRFMTMNPEKNITMPLAASILAQDQAALLNPKR